MSESERSSLTRALPPISRGPSDSGERFSPNERFSPKSVLESSVRTSLTKLRSSTDADLLIGTPAKPIPHPEACGGGAAALQPNAPTVISASLPQLLPTNTASVGRSNRFNKLAPLSAPLTGGSIGPASGVLSELPVPVRSTGASAFITDATSPQETSVVAESPETGAAPSMRSPLMARSKSLPQVPIAPAPPTSGGSSLAGALGAGAPRRPAGRAALSTGLGVPAAGATAAASSHTTRVGSLTADPPPLRRAVGPVH